MAEIRQNIDPTLTDSRQIVAGDNRVGNSDFALNNFNLGSVVVPPGNDTLVCNDWRLNNNNTTVSYTGSVINYGSVVGVPRRALRSTCTSSGSIGATASSGIRTPISTFDLEDLFLGSTKQQPFFITLLVRSNKTGSNTVALLGSGAAPTEVAYPTTFNTVANTWVQATLGPFSNVNTGAFTGLSGTNFLELWFALAAGTSVRGWSSGVVQTGSNRALTGSLSYDTSGDFIEIGEVQLIRGAIPRTWAANANYPSRFPSSGGISDTSQVVAGYNRVINSGYLVNQYNADASTAAASGFANACDMWKVTNGSSTGSAAVSFINGTFSATTPKKALRVTWAGASTLAATADVSLLTVIPPSDLADLDIGTVNQKPFSITFKVRSSKTGSNTVILLGSGSGASTVNYPVSFATVANTWTQVTIPVNNLTSGAWTGIGTNALIYLIFTLGAGSSIQGASSGSVQTSANRLITGSQQYVTAGDTFDVGEVQIINGATPRIWEARRFSEELYQCQRFYQKSYPYATTVGAVNSPGFERRNFGGVTSRSTDSLLTPLTTLMHRPPSPTAYSWSTGAVNAVRNNATSADTSTLAYSNISERVFDINATFAAAYTNADHIYHWTAEVAY
jgi:hypothetical protein